MKKPLTAILIIAFVDLVGFGLIIPLLPVYSNRMSATGLTLGFLVGSYSLAQMIFNPILGRLSDRFGRRPILLISIGGSVFSHLLLGFADLQGSLAMLFVARVLDGITGANVATAQACIADVTEPENRARGMGFFGAAFGLGFILGPGIGAGLYALGSLLGPEAHASSWPAFGATGIAAIAFVLAYAWLPESAPGKTRRTDDEPTTSGATADRFALRGWRGVASILRTHSLLQFIMLMFTNLFAFVLLEVTFSYLCIQKFNIGFAGIGLIFAYIGIIIVVVQGGLVGRLVKSFGELGMISVAPFLTGAGFIMIALVPQLDSTTTAWVVLLAACIPIASGNGLFNPSIMSLISRKAAAEHQGGTLGIAQGFSACARAVSPPIGGWLYDKGQSLPYVAGAMLLVFVGVRANQLRHRNAGERK